MQTRINKFISETGFCSRREADKLVESGSVTVNGVKAELGTKVNEGDVVLINGKPLKTKQKSVYIAFNKPVGVTCTTDLKDKDNIIDFIKHPERIFPIGRLDKPSEGLIFLTNDGDIVNKILRAGNNHEKEYVVIVDKSITDDFIQKMGAGVMIMGVMTQKCFIKKEDNRKFRIILKQGLNRQIRKMCDVLGYKVEQLKRVRIMNVKLDGIKVGEWRDLSASEMKIINELTQNSSKTEEASQLNEIE